MKVTSLAVLFTLSTILLQASLNFPEILVEKAPLAFQIITQARATALAGLLSLLLCGFLLWTISIDIKGRTPNPAGSQILLAGRSAAAAWMLSALGLLIIALSWSSSSQAQLFLIISRLALLLFGILAPLLLSYFTIQTSGVLRAYRVFGLISGVGLLLISFCSIVWLANSLLPVEDGFFETAEILSLLAVLGKSVWVAWLFLISFRPIIPMESRPIVPVRRNIFTLAMGAGIFILGLVFTLGFTALNLLAFSYPQTDAVPSEPSLSGALLYQVIGVYEGLIHPVRTVEQSQEQTYGVSQPLPAGVSLENLSISGVPAQYLCASGAAKGHVILYLHGGGFVAPLNDQHRLFTAGLSKATGACVLLPEYRLAPQNPYPAGLQDCLQAYRWLLSQGIAPNHIVIMGESAGANLTLAAVLSLRDQHEPLPAALVSLSAPTDLTMSSRSYTTKARVDPILGSGLPEAVYRAYTDHHPDELKSPYVSPLFADLHGLPPTFLLVGTQEVLLDDSERMAEKMHADGVRVRIDIWPGMWHTWPLVGDFMPDSRLATQQIIAFIQQEWGK